jgi:hypothetical protein
MSKAEMSETAKGCWKKVGGRDSSGPALFEMIQRHQTAVAEQEEWHAFWSGPVEFERTGEIILRHEWVRDFIEELNMSIRDGGYIFAHGIPMMRRRLMYWLYALAQKGWDAPPPPMYDGHRNNAADFDAFDYKFGYSDYWISLVDKWKTVDMIETYEDCLKAQLEEFVYNNIDTTNSPAIQEADELERALDEADAEEDGRHDDKKRDAYYQDAGYYKGNRDYT